MTLDYFKRCFGHYSYLYTLTVFSYKKLKFLLFAKSRTFCAYTLSASCSHILCVFWSRCKSHLHASLLLLTCFAGLAYALRLFQPLSYCRTAHRLSSLRWLLRLLSCCRSSLHAPYVPTTLLVIVGLPTRSVRSGDYYDCSPIAG